MKECFVLILMAFVSIATAQPSQYTVANCHSHNDYEQKMPFRAAYNAGFGSIEADIFLETGSLYVAHDTNELKRHRTLEEYYLIPLQEVVKKNNGHPFADTKKHLQLLIDIKTDSIKTLNTLIELLIKFPLLSNNPSIKFVVTGNRPDESLFTSYPSFIWFDGELFKNYSKEALTKICLLSDDFKHYSHWNGKDSLPQKELAAVEMAINKAHQLTKPVRFWDAPDFMNAWDQLMHLKVDFINTDHIAALSSFIKNLPKTSFTSTNTHK